MTKTTTNRCKVTPPALAKSWGISVDKVLTWIRSGELRAIDASTRHGGRPRYLIDPVDVEAFEAKRTVQPQVPHTRRGRRPRDGSVTEFF